VYTLDGGVLALDRAHERRAAADDAAPAGPGGAGDRAEGPGRPRAAGGRERRVAEAPRGRAGSGVGGEGRGRRGEGRGRRGDGDGGGHRMGMGTGRREFRMKRGESAARLL
jgi:hypothetical protein